MAKLLKKLRGRREQTGMELCPAAQRCIDAYATLLDRAIHEDWEPTVHRPDGTVAKRG